MGVITDGDQSRADFIVTTEANKRIRQLEELNRVLSAEVDKMRPVVEAAIVHLENPDGISMQKRDASLWMAVTTYEASKPK